MLKIIKPPRSKDVAHLLDINSNKVIELARCKKLRGIWQSRYWRFSLADVMAYKKKQLEE